MPIRNFRCPDCGYEIQTKSEAPICQHGEIDGPEPTHMELVLVAPTTKFMEKADPERGKSSLVNQEKILKERARKHSRDIEMHDLIQMNKPEEAIKNGWVNENGIKRRAIDDK